jgi:alpha-mannosidase
MAGRKTLHIISQAHLDPVWLWPMRDGVSEALTTMQSAADRLAETPEYRFSRSSAATYRWVETMDPRLFAEIRARIAEGRWEIVNGWIEQPDCNIPSTESLARHCLYGKGYFADRFGVDVRIGYNVDTFGHTGGQPQILTRAGYGYYVFMRPGLHERPGTPLLFWWEGPDGSRVLCYRVPMGYNLGTGMQTDQVEAHIRAHWAAHFPEGFDHGALFLGVGNHGGGPTKAHIARVRAMMADDTLPEIRFSTMADFFAAVEAAPAFADLPMVHDELQHHARGCYAAMGEIKALNRRAERTLGRGEALAVLAGLDAPFDYPTDALREAWWAVCFNQFHDILAGSSILPAYEQARDQLGAACDTGDALTIRAVHALSRRIDTTGAPEGVLTLANPLPWARTAVAQFSTQRAPHGEPITHLRTQDGTAYPLQWLPRGLFDADPQGWFAPAIASVPLPACGYTAFHLAHGTEPDVPVWTPIADPAEHTVGLGSLRADDGTELLAGPVSLVVLDDTSDTWGHAVVKWNTELGRPQLGDTRVMADGPVCRVVRQRATWGASTITLDIITYRDLDAVELRLEAFWAERHQQLRLEVPTRLQNAVAVAKVAGGIAVRPTHGEEEPCQDYVALQGMLDGAPYTVALLNAGSYSYEATGGRLRMIALRSAPFAHHDPVALPEHGGVSYQDQGRQVRRFWLVRGRGPAAALALDRRADEAQTPAEYAQDSAHPGNAPWSRSYLSVSPDTVAVCTLKLAEDGINIVLRLQEMAGVATKCSIAIGDAMIVHPLAPWELATLRLTLDGDGGVRCTPVGILER